MWFLSPPTLVFVFFKSQCLRMVEIACFRWSRFLVPANLWRTDAKTRVPSGCGPGFQDIHPFTTSRKRRGSGSRAARRAACCPYIFFSVNILFIYFQIFYFRNVFFILVDKIGAICIKKRLVGSVGCSEGSTLASSRFLVFSFLFFQNFLSFFERTLLQSPCRGRWVLRTFTHG